MAILSRPKNDTSILPPVVVQVFPDRRSHMRFLAFHLEVSNSDRAMVAWFISAIAKSMFRRRPRNFGNSTCAVFFFNKLLEMLRRVKATSGRPIGPKRTCGFRTAQTRI
jgi:hypothetical protein